MAFDDRQWRIEAPACNLVGCSGQLLQGIGDTPDGHSADKERDNQYVDYCQQHKRPNDNAKHINRNGGNDDSQYPVGMLYGYVE